MYNIMITGAGKIGSLIASLLAECSDYQVHLADMQFSSHDIKQTRQVMPHIKLVTIDVTNQEAMLAYIKKHQIIALISSLPYFLNTYIANLAKLAKTHYFDLTEDTATTNEVKLIAEGAETAFVPQCGLAPGFITIAANSLLEEYDVCYHAKLRVGALPQQVSNALHYALTWSTDGIINEYANPCHAIEDGKPTLLTPLEGLERIQIDGCEYEAFNTSGGLGSLSELYTHKIQKMDYKTIRYPGHCEKMHFLMNDLKLNQDRPTLKRILENAIPKTYQDLVLIYVSTQGLKHGELIETSYVKKIYPKIIHGIQRSAIQVSTASGICAVVDLVLGQVNEHHGLILQENFKLKQILANRFGQYYQ